jgi:hypothetical protein
MTRTNLLKIALAVTGVAFLLIYPMGLIWPSGWVWHGGQGSYYLQMICAVYVVLGGFLIAAARNPVAYRSVISFTVWSSVAHGVVMGLQAMGDGHEMGHMLGDVPALLLVALVLGLLSVGLKPAGSAAVPG